jgi:hypothetical protein
LHTDLTTTPRAVPSRVDLLSPTTPERPEVEAFIRGRFARAWGAEVRHFLPTLMSLRDEGGRLLGALGLRPAADRSLFLEHYLDRPVEQALAAAVGEPIDRAGVVEVGNLAVSAPGGGRWLIAALTAYLHAARADWVVFTCGPALRNAFLRLGVELLDLCAAEPARLPVGEAAHWGRYYGQRPRVTAARVSQSHGALRALDEAEDELGRLWRGAGVAGRLAA